MDIRKWEGESHRKPIQWNNDRKLSKSWEWYRHQGPGNSVVPTDSDQKDSSLSSLFRLSKAKERMLSKG